MIGKLPVISESPMAQLFLSGAGLVTEQPPDDCSKECSSKKDISTACEAYLHLSKQLTESLTKR
ncbi:hypothetical protein OESDEN_02102 [Oesophagostomum dentatum]|uniref:Uncharacterized protein n=1 Tax=Oesophagostomum dentatum TaxID=61180 RepID=A0A0B1TP84_OESDE|nr:hypothetical protein OESDEN_02102 [Oesophagostomum dentatum]